VSALPYQICDVFTDRALTGNPLAVFTDGRALDGATMQALAREMNLSETTFVLPGDAAFLAWAIWWPRATDALVASEDIASLRELLVSFGKPRAVRRHLDRLRRLVVFGEAPVYAERAWWEDVGVPLQPLALSPVD